MVEICILPLEFVLSSKAYTKLNRYLMGTLFCVPLCVSALLASATTWLTLHPPHSCAIALFETHFDGTRAKDFAALTEEPDEFGDAEEDPQPCRTTDDMGDAEEEGLEISKVSFEELKKALPSLTRSVQGEILWEVSGEG